MHLPPLPTIREIIRLYGLQATKHLSQNFLMDSKLTNKIVRSAGQLKGHHVCEVGPGPGGITRSVLRTGPASVVVVEKDHRFIPSLELLADASDDRLKIIHGDILTTEIDRVFDGVAESVDWGADPPKVHVIGNLPFNVSTPLIVRWLHDVAARRGAFRFGRTKLTLTFQKEVAERIVAGVGGQQRSRLSIMSQYLCHVKHLFTIGGRSFVPSPKVDVGVVQFTPRVTPLIAAPSPVVEKVVKHVFHYRQKHCRRGYDTLFPESLKHLSEEGFSRTGVDPTTRPCFLTMTQFRLLSEYYSEVCNGIPELLGYDYRDSRSREQWE